MIPFSNNDISYLAVELPDSVKYYKYAGDFRGELRELARLLDGELPDALAHRLVIEQVIAGGMCHDYNTDFDGLLSEIAACYPACDAEMLHRMLSQGHADYIIRDGRPYYQNSAAANLINCHQTELRRLTDAAYRPENARDAQSLEQVRRMRQNGYSAWRFTVCEEIWVADGAQRPGEVIRVHLPYPAVCQSQPEDGIHFIDCSHPDYYISDGPQRTLCITTPYQPGERFSVTFSYINRAPYRNLASRAEFCPVPASAYSPTDNYLGEQYPHIRFTPFIDALATEIAGNERDPLTLARRVYDWVTHNVKYSYMREYLFIDNIPEFAALNRRGDCGVMALLFITLCRRLGIPSKWESGSSVRPDSIGSHDWAMFYVEPYGWLYADPSFGGGALRRGCTELWEHYFGNLDPFRMVANNDFQQPFDPPKRFMRTDPYDNQSGEAEFESYGLGFGELKKSRRVLSAEAVD